MKIIKIQDRYSKSKIWIIKKSKCGHYYMNQEISGRQFYKKFTRINKQHLISCVGEFEI